MRVMPTTTIFRFFTGGAKAKTWINLDFPHFFHYIKSFQIVPGIGNTTFRLNGQNICPAGKPEILSQTQGQVL